MTWFVKYNQTRNTHGFGHVPDPPDPPECKERFIEEFCQDCSDYDKCKAEYDGLVGDDDADN